MTEITISVGLNDAATKRQEYQTEVYVDVMKHVCKRHRKKPLFFVFLTRRKVWWMPSQEISAPFSIKNPS